ncbi:MAG: NADH-quinone oxidoreductase subunit NuoB [Deltaproteobacteria bacterium]|nr:MAG: NADH-quinone oxidoreductase subunit NuoB [Deltaproteobacteria bacterium]
MLKILTERLRQGHRTMKWPDGPAPALDPRWRGAPTIDRARCEPGCDACAAACPTDAIALDPERATVDLGRCLFCTDCVAACPSGAVTHGRDFSLAARDREALLTDGEVVAKAQALDKAARKLFGRSLKLRQVSAGGCNACEADVNVLGTIGWDLGRFGVQFVASPRHADGLLITGPVSRNMELALRKTWEAVPAPKLVIAVGACAISGGPFRDHPEVLNGADALVPVDLYIPGCPPHPLTTLDGLLRLLGRVGER